MIPAGTNRTLALCDPAINVTQGKEDCEAPFENCGVDVFSYHLVLIPQLNECVRKHLSLSTPTYQDKFNCSL